MSPTPEMSERRAIERIARDYKKEGYEVLVMPLPKDRPAPVRDFEVDLIARKGNEVVIVELKRSTSKKRDPRLREIAARLQDLPGYRFDMVAVPQPLPQDRDNWLDERALWARVDEATLHHRSGSFAASVMLLWSVTEGALRLIADNQKLRISSAGPAILIKTLYSHGLLNRDEQDFLERMGQLRNSAVHALKIERIDDQEFHRWFTLVRKLLERAQLGGR